MVVVVPRVGEAIAKKKKRPKIYRDHRVHAAAVHGRKIILLLHRGNNIMHGSSTATNRGRLTCVRVKTSCYIGNNTTVRSTSAKRCSVPTARAVIAT